MLMKKKMQLSVTHTVVGDFGVMAQSAGANVLPENQTVVLLALVLAASARTWSLVF